MNVYIFNISFFYLMLSMLPINGVVSIYLLGGGGGAIFWLAGGFSIISRHSKLL